MTRWRSRNGRQKLAMFQAIAADRRTIYRTEEVREDASAPIWHWILIQVTVFRIDRG